MIQLVEIVEAPASASFKDRFHIREIYLSPEHIIMVREERNVERVIFETKNEVPGIPSGMKFTKLTINRGTTGQDIIVLGSVDMIHEKIQKSLSKKLLKG
jgi:hypothetical protein